jgi:DNA-binding transcriptional ArsR family regulator
MSQPPKPNPAIAAIVSEIEKHERIRDDAAKMAEALRLLKLNIEHAEYAATKQVSAAPKRAAPNSVKNAVLEALGVGGHSIRELGEAISGAQRSSIRAALASLLKAGKVTETPAGAWALRVDEAKAAE